MAFKEEYTRLLSQARRERIPPRWSLTPGADPDHREQVVTDAATKGLLSAAYAAGLLPYHQPPTPAGQKLLDAVKAIALPAPADAPPDNAPPLTVPERIALLKAAVTGAPPPMPAPVPRQPPPSGPAPDEPDRLLADARARYQARPEDAAPVWTPPVDQETPA